MARYINLGSQPIKFGIGSSPGLPWTRYDSAPGGVVEGPAGYLRSFMDAGYTLVTPDIQTMLDEDAARAAAPKVEATVEVKIERVEAVASDPDQLTLGVVETTEPEAPEVQAVDSPPAKPVAFDPSKGRRRGRNQ
jgi:hypothetical protein